jgi:hypothetical protein
MQRRKDVAEQACFGFVTILLEQCKRCRIQISRFAVERSFGPLLEDILHNWQCRKGAGPTRVKRQLRHHFRHLRTG